MDNLENLKKAIGKYFQNFGPHDFSHTARVFETAVQIAQEEGANLHVVAHAALLHDVARLRESKDKSICHAKEGAVMAKEILGEAAENIDEIVYCIQVHRFSKGIVPESLEAKILQDADRLDSLGAVVIARTFAQDGISQKPIFDPEIKPNEKYTGSSATGINHLYEKILQIKPESFHTSTGQQMSKNRYAFVKAYVEQFLDEWVGKR